VVPGCFISSSIAAELLINTNMTAAEIAYKVGFEDQYYFSKSFKKYFGVPPSKYRRGEIENQ
jgi:AraC-like DNA-binding protein